jgi:hypothetical protein
MRSTTKAITIATVGLAAAGLLAACGGSSGDAASGSTTPSAAVPSTSLAPTAAPVASPSGALVGGDPSTWTPVDITQSMNGTKVKLVVGQVAVFSDLPPNDATNTIVVRAKPKGVVTVTQQTANSNAGLQAVATGKTVVTVYDGLPKDSNTQVVMQFTVRVKLAPTASASPAAQ